MAFEPGAGGPTIEVSDRTSTDAELTRAIRGFAQRLRTPRSVPTADVHMLVAPFDGGGSDIPAGQVVRVPVAWECDIVEWLIVADAAGSITFDVQRAAWADYPTLVSAGAASVSGAQKGRGSTAGWTITHLRDGDVLVVSTGAASGIGNATLGLRIRLS